MAKQIFFCSQCKNCMPLPNYWIVYFPQIMAMVHEIQEIIIYEYTCIYKKKGQVRKSREIQINWANIFLTNMDKFFNVVFIRFPNL